MGTATPENTTSYRVVSNGQLKEGFELEAVQTAFATLFKIQEEQAKGIVGTKKVIKKGLNAEKARSYKQKLENIGLVIDIERGAENPALSLSLSPIESKHDTVSMTCPKCNLKQSASDECSGCGIIFSKFKSHQETGLSATNLAPNNQTNTLTQPPAPENQSSQISSDEDREIAFGEDQFNIKSLGAASAAAVLGALIWMAIAMISGYELGLVAWGIGGAIGFAATLFGSRGQKAGIACGALALVAILGGKYLVIDSLTSQFADLFGMETMEEGLQEAYTYIVYEAELYTTEVTDDASLRAFIAENEYSGSYDATEVTAEEINYFNEEVVPEFNYILENNPSYEEWFNHTVGEAMGGLESLSTWSLMMEDFGALSLLFLFMGVATAYQLGSGQKKFG